MLHPNEARSQVLRGMQREMQRFQQSQPARDARLLVQWLNAKPERSAQKHIINLLTSFRALAESDSRDSSQTSVVRVVRPFGKVHQQRSDPRLLSIKRELRSYRAFVSAFFGRQGWRLNWECSQPVSIAEMEQRAAAGTLDRGQAFDLLCRLSREDSLGLVRQCTRCGKWFFAKQAPQVFCSKDCQREKYRSREEWREHRRKYMRDYRRNERAGLKEGGKQ